MYCLFSVALPPSPMTDRTQPWLWSVWLTLWRLGGGGGGKTRHLCWIGSRQIKAPCQTTMQTNLNTLQIYNGKLKILQTHFFCPMLKSELHCSRIYFSFSWRSKKFYLGHISFGPFSRHFLLSKLNILKTATPGTNNMSSYLVTILYTD